MMGRELNPTIDDVQSIAFSLLPCAWRLAQLDNLKTELQKQRAENWACQASVDVETSLDKAIAELQQRA